MKRRTFLQSSAGLLLFKGEAVWSAPRWRATHVLRGALVFDGTGAPPREADVALEGERIIGVGPRIEAGRVAETSLRGLALAPGFVDIHSHTDLNLLVNPRAESKVRQGVTTEVTGQDGGSVGPWSDEAYQETRADYRSRYGVDLPFRDVGGFLRWMDQHGAAVHVASMVGQGTIRGRVVGHADRPATEAELRRMKEEVSRALADGACGLSSGLEYTPGAFGSTAELAELASALAGTGLPYASHMRNEDDRLFAAVEEAIQVGRIAGVPVEISHLKAQGRRNWWKSATTLQAVEQARAAGVQVGIDVYPYVAYSTGLANLFPISARDGGTDAFLARLRDPARLAALEPAVRGKIDQLGSWDSVQVTSTGSDALAWARGRKLGELAAQRGVDPFRLLVQIVVEDRNRAGMVGFGMSEENVERTLAHPLAAVCSDGAAWAPYGPLSSGVPHPRTYGTFPRVLGRYVRERRILPLEAAIHKMTALPARRVGLHDRGTVAPGARADLVAFDPDTVADRATFERPHQYPVGIPHVWVNGVAVIQGGEHTGARPGRAARPRR
ncbi:MAG TPA: D-aminoacylase [Longimicrobium sp.]|jgi:N-acyl-D-amino-acid deacylase